MKVNFLLALMIASLLAPSREPSIQESPIPVHFIELIAVPERYEGKLITVTGFMTFLERAEGERPHRIHGTPFLFFHREDYENELGNAFWVQPNEQMRRDKEKLNLMYVDVTGRFVRLGPPSDPKARTFVIKDVQGCTPWSDPNRPRNLRSPDEKFK